MSVNVNVEDGLTNGATGVFKFVEYIIEDSNRPSIIWMKFDELRIFTIQIFKRGWTPVFESVYRFKMRQWIQFPLQAAAAKTVHKAQGITKNEIVVDLAQYKGTRKVPHIHYVAFHCS